MLLQEFGMEEQNLWRGNYSALEEREREGARTGREQVRKEGGKGSKQAEDSSLVIINTVLALKRNLGF